MYAAVFVFMACGKNVFKKNHYKRHLIRVAVFKDTRIICTSLCMLIILHEIRTRYTIKVLLICFQHICTCTHTHVHWMGNNNKKYFNLSATERKTLLFIIILLCIVYTWIKCLNGSIHSAVRLFSLFEFSLVYLHFCFVYWNQWRK